MKRSVLGIVVAFAAVLLLFGAFLAVAWHFNFFQRVPTKDGQPSAAAAITLLGALMTAVASVLGILLKYSVDARAEDRLAAEGEHRKKLEDDAAERTRLETQRNAVLQRDVEQRLKLEAATEALKLLVTGNNELAPHLQRAGVLFTLASLGAFDLNLALLSEMLAHSQIEAAAAARILNTMLSSGDETTKFEATWLLYEHAEKLVTPNGFEFPTALMDDLKAFPTYVREWAPLALGKILLARPIEEWRDRNYMANSLLAALALAWTNETDERLREDLAVLLQPILAAFPSVALLYVPSGNVDIIKIRAETAAYAEAVSTGADDISQRLYLWAGVAPRGHATAP